ncbi:MAG: molecular chaperone HtpG [Chitinophagales bacterium]|nr:molecular chaperone HtpG [Chitinophagales bacterium]
MAKGKIKVNTDNIFPIIKKFLYSDHEIFLRELVSNAVDATQKLKKLHSIGEYKGDLDDLAIKIRIDKENGTLHVIDQGIGMTAEEVKKYINQIAFSSAESFLEKFKDLEDSAAIIGHFGLGFYSAFMVSDKVELITKSYKDEDAASWTCDGTPNYDLKKANKTERGTEVILHIADDSKEFLEENRISDILNKYCKFLPIEIIFGEQTKTEKDKDGKEVQTSEPKVINNPKPAWIQKPAKLKDEDYLNFYNELYPFSEPPLFWIHLNVDFPFNLTGILYFPKIQESNFEIQKKRIQLYSNQVFVTDQVEEIVPEFLMLLQGVIDSPDIPLNVSRSYLQSDANVKKINKYISKKVADELSKLFSKKRPDFEEKWSSIGLFVKYGMISDEKFYEKAKSFCLLENMEGKFFSIEEYKEKVKALQTDKNNKVVFLYSNQLEDQHTYIEAAKERSYEVIKLDNVIDNHFMQQVEMKFDDVVFKRVDADTPEKLIEKENENTSVLSSDEEEKLKNIYAEVVEKPEVEIELQALSPNDHPVMITKPEINRRMKEMASMGGGAMSFMGQMPDQLKLIVNTNHPLASKILRSKAKKKQLVQQLFDLALLSQNMLRGSDLTDFINRSVDVIND